jgi:predicted permease
MSRPPRIAERLLHALLPLHERDEVLGDLAEAHGLRAARSPLAANVWYWAQVLMIPIWILGSAMGSTRFDVAEVRRTVRGLVQSPGFALVAVLSLGLGIGATTAISGALQALLFVTLPVGNPEEVSLLYHTWPEEWEGGQYGSSNAMDPGDGATVFSNISYPAYQLAREAVGESIELAGYAFIREMSVVRGDAPAMAASGMLVSGNYFSTLRLGVALGRPLTEADNIPEPRSAVLSHSYWLRAFGGDPRIVDSEVLLNGRPFTIVGVAEEGYVGLSPGGFFGPSEVILPLTANDLFITLRPRDGETTMTAKLIHWIRLVARTPAGSNVEPIREVMNATLRGHLIEVGVVEAGVAADFDMRFLEGKRGLDSLRVDTTMPLTILTIVVVIVLLIACANLTTLLLARGAAKTPEMALRRAIGASKWELARPQILESLLLGVLGGAVGLASAMWAGPRVVSALTDGSGSAAVSYELNWVLLLTAATAGLIAAGLSGWIPALHMMRADPAQQMGARSQGGAANRFRLGRFLIAAQIAISVPLVVGAGLFLQTLGNLTSIDPGFDTENLIIFGVDAGHATRDRAEQNTIYERILSELERLDGVQSVSVVENVLVSGWQSNSNATVDGESVMLDMNAVSPDFLETMGIELLSGRMVNESDGPDQPRVVVMNQTAEKMLFDGQAVGRTFTMNDRELQVVGVVNDTKYSSLKGDARPGFIDSWRQRPGGLWTVNFAVRTERSKAQLEPVVRRLVANADARLPVTRFRSQGDEIERQAARERVFAQLLSLFGGFALLLSCIGLHGVMSFAVSQRRSEMGVRLALGAAPVSIVSMVLAQVVRLTLVGLAVGLLVAWRVSPVVDAMLFGIESGDAGIMVVAAVLMCAVALAAGFLPAWKASRVDPLKSLAPSGGG